MARTVFGVPLHDNARHLPQALASLLHQTDRDLALVLVDDTSTDSTPQVAAAHAGEPRVAYERNHVRLGLAGTWQRALEAARERHPEARYFAWGSDHDVWDPRWLERLRAELDRHPGAVLAYPLVERIGDDGESARAGAPWRFDTAGVADPRERFSRFCRRGVSGDMVYGLFRLDALSGRGFPQALMPDRLLLAEMALAGEFRQVPEVLWRRRYVRAVTARRQRSASFPGRAPAWSRVPWPLVHAARLARIAGPGPAAIYLTTSLWRLARKQLLVPVARLRLGERLAAARARRRPSRRSDGLS